MDQRFAVGHGQHEGDRALRLHRDRCSPAGFDCQFGVAGQGQRERPPLADQVRAAASDPRPAVVLAEAGVELDHGLDGFALGR